MSARAWLSKKLPSGKILCLACAHACKLDEGETGICGVRKVKNGELKLLVYGKAAAMNVDPIEKKPLFHFLPSTRVFSFGTVGCNLSCSFCQNFEISQFHKENRPVFGRDLPPETAVDLALQYGCKSIAYTYNEPIVWFEYSYDTAKLAREKGLKNVYVTSGYETKEAMKYLKEVIDAMNIDLKAFTDEFYRKLCGARLKPVLQAIEEAYKDDIWIEITTLFIPGENDSEEEMRKIANFIASIDTAIPWHVSGFYPTYKMTDKNPTPPETLLKAYEIGRAEGLKFVYVGNFNAPQFETTYCPVCGYPVIERSGYIGQEVTNHLKEGHCPKCGTFIPGVWS
ncbi:MAG: AmmeMemoRadiSam system radical SAM enzyme [Epsilonproteobacteria bacterium]|nr:AmmeMemoRadiSam system radical SAM enzyme [Campylobacterota bacterium]NPA64627.1 AmmeMemoRadiSam system radical SAM enzyme [Campylobacterota bacterium]